MKFQGSRNGSMLSATSTAGRLLAVLVCARAGHAHLSPQLRQATGAATEDHPWDFYADDAYFKPYGFFDVTMAHRVRSPDSNRSSSDSAHHDSDQGVYRNLT